MRAVAHTDRFVSWEEIHEEDCKYYRVHRNFDNSRRNWFRRGGGSGGGSCPQLSDGLLGIGAGLAIGLAAIGVGIAQGYIGSAGLGLLAERPGAFGQVLIYLVIPETLIIFGFVIAFFLNGQIGG